MTAIIVLGGLCMVSALVTARFHSTGTHRQKFVFKLVSSLLFCVAGIVALYLRDTVDLVTALMLLALILGLAGDILLCLFSFINKEYNKFFYAVGGAVFLFGHVLYAVAMLLQGEFNVSFLPLILMVPLLYYALMKTGVLQPGSMRLPLLGYGFALSCMLAATVNLAAQGASAGPLVLPAGLLFVLSDTALFLHDYGRAGLRARYGRLLDYTVMLCYYAAQMLFAASITLL